MTGTNQPNMFSPFQMSGFGMQPAQGFDMFASAPPGMKPYLQQYAQQFSGGMPVQPGVQIPGVAGSGIATANVKQWAEGAKSTLINDMKSSNIPLLSGSMNVFFNLGYMASGQGQADPNISNIGKLGVQAIKAAHKGGLNSKAEIKNTAAQIRQTVQQMSASLRPDQLKEINMALDKLDRASTKDYPRASMMQLEVIQAFGRISNAFAASGPGNQFDIAQLSPVGKKPPQQKPASAEAGAPEQAGGGKQDGPVPSLPGPSSNGPGSILQG